MKTILYLIVILGLTLTSCVNSRNNFNKQKFTKLKQLPSQHDQQDEGSYLSSTRTFDLTEEVETVENYETQFVEDEPQAADIIEEDQSSLVENDYFTETAHDSEVNTGRVENLISLRKKDGLSIRAKKNIITVAGFLALIAGISVLFISSFSVGALLSILMLLLMLVTLASFIISFILRKKELAKDLEESGDRDGIDDKDYQDARSHYRTTMFSRGILTLCFLMAGATTYMITFPIAITIAVILGLTVLACLIFNVGSNMKAAESMAKHVKNGKELSLKAKFMRFAIWLELVYVGAPLLWIPMIISLVKVRRIRKGV